MTAIEIVGDKQSWRATLSDERAARDFLALLPLELELSDYAGTEKIADLPRALSRSGAPAAITPKTGDIAFYAPWGNLAIFYRDGHHSPGLILLGRIEAGVDDFAVGGTMTVLVRQAATDRPEQR